VTLKSPCSEGRDNAWRIHLDSGLRFLKVFVDTPVEVYAARDPKGLYVCSRGVMLPGLTGIDDLYEPLLHPELVIATGKETLVVSVPKVTDSLREMSEDKP
jgi:bifunctional enzyme CysN/CysC